MKTFGGKWKNNSFELPIAVTWKQMLRYKNMRGRTELYTVHDEFWIKNTTFVHIINSAHEDWREEMKRKQK